MLRAYDVIPMPFNRHTAAGSENKRNKLQSVNSPITLIIKVQQ